MFIVQKMNELKKMGELFGKNRRLFYLISEGRFFFKLL